MQTERKCVICGKTFKAGRKNRITCSTECSEKNRSLCQEIYRANNRDKKRAKKAMSKIKKNNLYTVEAEARAHGMSYGEYEAMQYMKQSNR